MVLFEGATAAIALSAGLAIAAGALATAWAQASIGSAAMGVIAEKPEEASKLIIWLALPETMVILGFAVAAMIVFLKI
ncbi:MAG: ATPase [Candidatus Diapherotrites archaeon]|nr:ATPase [Candidatus Diapherotrites archaeon]